MEASSYRSYAPHPCAVTNERRPRHEEGRARSPVELENRSRDISVSQRRQVLRVPLPMLHRWYRPGTGTAAVPRRNKSGPVDTGRDHDGNTIRPRSKARATN